MKNSSTISSKGQITIPLAIRRHLGLKEGDRVEFVIENGRTVFQSSKRGKNPFANYVGVLPAFTGEKEINRWVRSLRDETDRDA